MALEAKFFCRTGTLAGADHRIGDDATIGRGPGNTIVLTDDVVSIAHARIAFDPGVATYFLEDLESTNGTRLDGVPVSGRQRLGDLHVVTFGGQHDFIFVALPEGGRQAGSAESADPPPRARSVEPAASYEPPPALDVPPLEAVEGVGEPEPQGEEPVAPVAVAVPGGRAGDEAASQLVEEAPATRYEAPPALDVPLLEAVEGVGEPEPQGEEPVAPVSEAVPGGRAGDEAASQPVEAPATRYEAAPELQVPRLAAELEPPEKESRPAAPDDAGREDAAVAPPPEPATWHEPPRALDVPPLAAAAAKPSGAIVEVAIADGKPERVTLGDGRHVLGRGRDCAIPVADMTLSRRHAAFVVRGDSMTVTDLNSLNGTFVDDEPVDSPTVVGVGQTVNFGNRVRVVRVAP